VKGRLDPVALAGAAAWATGAWLASGAVAAPAQGERLGVLAPWWLLAVLAVVAAVAVIVSRPVSRQTTPLFLPLVSIVPWLPIAVTPAWLLTVGPPGQALAVCALVVTCVRGAPQIGRPVRHVTAVAVMAMTVLFLASAWWVSPRIPGGDEPHYLIITQSLLHDGDLRIQDNHDRREYAAYVDGDLRPDYLRRGRDQAIYSIHAPGLSALVLPAFAIGGYPAVVVWLALLSAIGLVLTWRVAYEASGDAAAATVAAAGVGLSVPFFFQTFTAFPDGPAAVIVAAVVWLGVVRTQPASWPMALVCGALIGLLPWLHTRYAAIAAPLGLIVASRLVREPRALLALALPAVAALAAWLGMFQAIYGTWDPRAPYGHATDMRLARIPHGVSALLLDQQFGLIVNAPIYLVAFAGWVPLIRHRRRLALELAAITVPYVIAVAGFHMWWGGRSSPVRFLVPVLLPMAVPLAAWWTLHATRTARAVGWSLLVASLALTAAFVLVDRGALIYNSRDGHALWLLAASSAVNLTFALPSLFQAGPSTAWTVAAIWGLTATVGWLLLRRIELGGVSYGPWRAAVLAIGALVIGIAVSAALAMSPWPPVDGAASVAVLARACEPGAIAVGPDHLSVASARDAVAGATISDASRRPDPRRRARWSARDVPPGIYEVVLRSGLNLNGTLTIALGRPEMVLSRCGLGHQPPGPTSCEVALPAGASALWITGDQSLDASVEAVDLVVREIAPPSACGLRAERALVHLGGPWFVTGGRAWVEGQGLWTAGNGHVELAAAPADAIVRLRVRQGGEPGLIRLSSGSWSGERHLAAGEVWDLDLPRSQSGVVTWAVDSPSGFRPSDRDRASTDTRVLGAWVEPR